MDKTGLDLEGQKLGKYDIAVAIGHGGMGVVYKATDTTLRRPVALKVLLPLLALDDAFVQRFRHEAVTAANLKHPHIVTIFEVGEQDGLYYIAMEYLPGHTLQQIIATEGRLSLKRAVNLLDQIADALTYAHHRGLIHRDVKPSNIIVDAQDNVTLTDFGIARAAESATGLTATQVRVGTPRYMSPEHALGAELDHRSDIYSLGVVLYEMLTGKAPFEAKTTSALLYAHVHRHPPAPSSINPSITKRVEQVLLKALAKRPDQRYQEANPMAQAFREAVKISKVVAAPRPQAFIPAAVTDLFREHGLLLPTLLGGVILMVIAVVLAMASLPPRWRGEVIASRDSVQTLPVAVPLVTASATPFPTDTAYPTPSYTITAAKIQTLTPTISPTPTPKFEPTSTLAPPSLPTTPGSPSPTGSLAVPRSPTPVGPTVRVYPIPVPIEPADRAGLEPGAVLRWEWGRQLAEDEYFDVRVWKEGQPHHGVTWTKVHEYRLPDRLASDNGEYYWSICVIRGKGGQWEADLSQESEPRRFTFTGKEERGRKPKCSERPDLRPPDCEP